MTFKSKFNENKTTEAACILLGRKGGRVEYLWLLKMLYIIDREAFNKWERPITYDYYQSLPKGPVPMTTYNLITGRAEGLLWRKYISSFSKKSTNRYEVQLNGSVPKIKNLSESEVDLINEKFDEFKDFVDQWDLVEYTHKHFPEWKEPRKNIFGKLICPQIEIEDILRKLEFNQEEINRIKIELRDEENIDFVFGG